MSDAFHERVKALFLDACDVAVERRAAWLDAACAGDAKLRRAVEELLENDDHPLEFVDAAAGGLAASLLSVEVGRERRDARDELPSAVDRRIGGYRVIRKLGSGGMGTVYEAEQETPRRRVALKVIRRGLTGPGHVRRFEREAQLLGRLNHPGIAQIYEAGVDVADGETSPFFAMELVDGRTLTEHARTRGLDLRERLELLARICDAVEHAHQHGVVHRDLKPGNVLVTDTGQPKVLDFGVARVSDGDLPSTTMRTDVGQVVGTLQYMSPEQASGGHEAVDARADVYALGVVGYELVAGRLPYDVSKVSFGEALRILREREPDTSTRTERGLDGDVRTILLKALEKDPARRYPTAGALADDLRRYLDDQPITAKPASRIYKLRKFASRNKPLVAAGAAITFSLIAGTVISFNYAVRADRERDIAFAAQQRAERRSDDVRALARVFMFDVHDEIMKLPGATAARRKLVETALAYLAKLSEDVETSPDRALRTELAEAYARIGDIQGNPRAPNLGDVEAALANYRRSLELREPLALEGPDAHVHLRAVAELEQRVGAIFNATGRHAQALESYGRSVEAIERVLADARDDFEAQRVLSGAVSLVGSTFEQMGRNADALEAYRRSYEAAETLVGKRPGDPRLLRDVSISCNEVALMLERLGRDDEARCYVDRALEIREALALAQPQDLRARRDLALSLHRVGSLRARAGDPASALELFRRAFEFLNAIADADPNDSRARYDLSVAYEKLAGVSLTLDRRADALASRRACRDLRAELVERNPDNLFHLAAFATACERLADAHLENGRPDLAEPAHEQALALAEQVLAANPTDAYALTVVVVASHDVARTVLDRAHAVEFSADVLDGGETVGDHHERRLLLLFAAREHLARGRAAWNAMVSESIKPIHGDVDLVALDAASAECDAALAR